MPVIGFLSSTSPQVYAVRLPAFAQDLEAAAPALGMQLHVVQASTDHDLNTVFAALRADALVVGPYLFFNSRLEQLGALSFRHAVPTIFTYREFVAAGGLISYGANETESYRLVGIYAGKILKGAKPSDLPVQSSTKGRADNQPQDCTGTRDHRSARAKRPSRRADRVEMQLVRCMSPFMARNRHGRPGRQGPVSRVERKSDFEVGFGKS